MNDNEIILVSQKVQEKFYNFSSKITRGLSKTDKKFIKDIGIGILSGKSSILRQIAQELKEKINLKKVIKRLTYHLDKEDLSEKLKDNQIRYISHNSDRNRLYIVDPSDILKKYAHKQEGLSRVRDGSTGKIGNGYETINIISADKVENEYNLNTVVSELYSNKIEIDTMKQVLFDRIIDIIIASDKKGVFVFDRGFDDKKLYSFFRDNDSSFIVRSTGIRDLYYKNEKIGFKNLAKKVKLSQSFKVKGRLFNAGIIDVEIPLDPHPRKKNPELFSAKLFVGRYKNGGYWYILFSLPNHNDLSEKELIEFVFNAYKIRWKIEEIHRHIKTEYQWESMRLGTYKRLKALNTILWIVVNFVYKMKSLKYNFIATFQHLMTDVIKRLDKIPNFIYYRISLSIRECFLLLRRYKKNKRKHSNEKSIQLLLSFD